MSPGIRTPALDTWRHELHAGHRTTRTYDALWRAACWEQSAVTARAAGMHKAARGDLARAVAILRAAAAETA